MIVRELFSFSNNSSQIRLPKCSVPVFFNQNSSAHAKAIKIAIGQTRSAAEESGESICRARDWDATHRRGAVHLQPRDGGRQSSGGELGEEEGWPGRGGRWAERPPARSPAAGVVGGRRRPLGSGLPGLQWPPDLEEGAGGGGGPAAEAVRPAEGAAARERCRWPRRREDHAAVARQRGGGLG